jgi:hypothetical protein
VPHGDGVGWLGEPGQRLSADLWSGGAGVLLTVRALTAALDPAPDPLDETTSRAAPEERSDQHGGSPALAG